MLQQTAPYIEISLDNLIYNLNRIRGKLQPDQSIIAVVKDNAYGCGATVIAQTLEQEGVTFFVVANMTEAQELRRHSVRSPILVLGECSKEDIQWASSHEVRITVNNITTLTDIAKLNTPVKFHINIDTGMGRMGISLSEVETAAEIINNNNHLQLEGIFTHFACADEPGTDSVVSQQKEFQDALTAIKRQGVSPHYIHSSNSAAIIRFPVPQDYLVRPGILLYGCKPDPAQEFPIDLRPIVSLKASIVKIKKISAGTAISYGWTFAPQEDTCIATVPIGYAHGYPRLLSNKGEVLIRGKRFPVAGRVTMDYIMVNLGPETDIQIGDEVVAIGTQGNETISPDDIALHADTIGYEILCGLSNLIDRYYYRDGKIIMQQPTPFS